MFGLRLAALLPSIVLAVALGGPSAGAAEPDAGRITQDFTDFLTFVESAPLASTDRERISAEAQKQLQSNPAALRAADDQVEKALAKIAHAKPWDKAYNRETLRLQMELRPSDDPIRQIVDRTDPVVVFDPGHKRLVTEGTLAAWQRAYTWMSGVLSVPGPQADFIAAERAFLKARFAALSDADAEAVAHVERNYPIMSLALAQTEAAKRDEFIRQARPLALDRGQFGLRLAEAMSQTFEAALHEEIVHDSILHAGILNAGLQYNMLYRTMLNHP